MAILYLVINKDNGKTYVGFTGGSVKRRKTQHYIAARYNQKHRPHKLTKFQKLLLAVPVDQLVWSTILEHRDRDWLLNEQEQHFINLYNSIENGYNQMGGGFCGPVLKGSANGMFGKTHTDEVKDQLRANGDRYRGKSYEERFGTEKANELREARSVSSKRYHSSVDLTGLNNSHADQTIYIFQRRDGNQFTGSRQEWMSTYPDLHKVGVCQLVKGRLKSYKGWTVKR